MIPETVLTYIDAKGKEHNALLVEEDQLHPGYVNLVYINAGVAQRMVSVPHESHPSKDESNPDLPRVALHCWREVQPEFVAGLNYDGGETDPQTIAMVTAERDGAPEVPAPSSPAAE